MHEGSRRAILAAFPADLGIAIAELIGALITRSAGPLAGGGNSPADTGNQLLRAQQAPRAEQAPRAAVPSAHLAVIEPDVHRTPSR